MRSAHSVSMSPTPKSIGRGIFWSKPGRALILCKITLWAATRRFRQTDAQRV
jgi:hypothetical protein